MLQGHELKLNPNHENYLHDTMHVYAQNVHCDAQNEHRLKLLHGREFTNLATGSKIEDFTELANVTMPTNPCETSNLRKVLTVKIDNARVLITTNIYVTDGLTNGAMDTVTNVVIDHTPGQISVILVAFDNEHVGQETRYTRVYNSRNQNAIPIHETQTTFPVDKKEPFQATRSQFPLTLAWAVTIHKCKGLSMSEIVIYMTCGKGKFKPGEAYVAFSRDKTLEKIHIIIYTQSQIYVSQYVEKEMRKLRKNILPQMPPNLFHNIPGGVKILHLNIGNLKRKIEDIKDGNIFRNSDIISSNEIHLFI